MIYLNILYFFVYILFTDYCFLGPLAQSVTRPNVPFGTGGEHKHIEKDYAMYMVYVLEDEEGKLYKGMTNDLKRRIQEHKRGKTRTTRKMIGIETVYVETFTNMENARKRELYLKSAAGRRYLKSKLKTRALSSVG